jgi:hypothetical protein
MCNLYSITKGQKAITDLVSAMRDLTGNMPPLPTARHRWCGRPLMASWPIKRKAPRAAVRGALEDAHRRVFLPHRVQVTAATFHRD